VGEAVSTGATETGELARIVGVAVGVGVTADVSDDLGDPAAIGGGVADPPPLSGPKPRKPVSSIPTARMTRPTPMMVRRGMPPELSPSDAG
jgi:hypothetical protein